MYMRVIIFNFQMTMVAPAILDHLQAISKEETSCTLVTSLGERVEVKFILMVLTDNLFISNISRCNPSCWLPSAHTWQLFSPR